MRPEYNGYSPVELGLEAPELEDDNPFPDAGPVVHVVCDCGQKVRDFHYDSMPGLLPAGWHAVEKGGGTRRVNVSLDRVGGRQKFDLHCRRCRFSVPARGEKMVKVLQMWSAAGQDRLTLQHLKRALSTV